MLTSGTLSFWVTETPGSERTPYWAAVAGMICIRPTAPLCEMAFGLKADSVAVTALTKA